MVASLETADRIVVADGLNHVIQETQQPDAVVAVLNLIHKYPTDWTSVMSGAGGDYVVNFYRGNELVGTVGLTSAGSAFPGRDTVFLGGTVRQVPKPDNEAGIEMAHALGRTSD